MDLLNYVDNNIHACSFLALKSFYLLYIAARAESRDQS